MSFVLGVLSLGSLCGLSEVVVHAHFHGCWEMFGMFHPV